MASLDFSFFIDLLASKTHSEAKTFVSTPMCHFTYNKTGVNSSIKEEGLFYNIELSISDRETAVLTLGTTVPLYLTTV